MAWSTPDLSDITQVVMGIIDKAIVDYNNNNSNPSLQLHNFKVSASSPETVRIHNDDMCQVTLYLLHVGRDPYWRNTPVNGPRPQLNKAQPLSLNLSYLLTSFCEADFTREQRAMSIALQAVHSQPIVTQALIQQDSLTQWLPDGEFNISIEADTIDDMSRLWQAFTVPIRLSALIRVSVVFIAPAAPMPTPALPPTVANLAVSPDPTASPAKPVLFAGTGQSFSAGTAHQRSRPGDSDERTADRGRRQHAGDRRRRARSRRGRCRVSQRTWHPDRMAGDSLAPEPDAGRPARPDAADGVCRFRKHDTAAAGGDTLAGDL
jgi:Pvc16 N-terminal domain